MTNFMEFLQAVGPVLLGLAGLAGLLYLFVLAILIPHYIYRTSIAARETANHARLILAGLETLQQDAKDVRMIYSETVLLRRIAAETRDLILKGQPPSEAP